MVQYFPWSMRSSQECKLTMSDHEEDEPIEDGRSDGLPPGWEWDPETFAAMKKDFHATELVKGGGLVGASETGEYDAGVTDKTRDQAIKDVQDEAWRIYRSHPGYQRAVRALCNVEGASYTDVRDPTRVRLNHMWLEEREKIVAEAVGPLDGPPPHPGAATVPVADTVIPHPRVDSMGTCKVCGYSGPGPLHEGCDDEKHREYSNSDVSRTDAFWKLVEEKGMEVRMMPKWKGGDGENNPTGTGVHMDYCRYCEKSDCPWLGGGACTGEVRRVEDVMLLSKAADAICWQCREHGSPGKNLKHHNSPSSAMASGECQAAKIWEIVREQETD
jgi:hypothetical protein